MSLPSSFYGQAYNYPFSGMDAQIPSYGYPSQDYGQYQNAYNALAPQANMFGAQQFQGAQTPADLQQFNKYGVNNDSGNSLMNSLMLQSAINPTYFGGSNNTGIMNSLSSRNFYSQGPYGTPDTMNQKKVNFGSGQSFDVNMFNPGSGVDFGNIMKDYSRAFGNLNQIKSQGSGLSGGDVGSISNQLNDIYKQQYDAYMKSGALGFQKNYVGMYGG